MLERERAELRHVVAVLLEARLGPAALEEEPRRRHGQREVAAGPRLHICVAEARRLVPDRIDEELGRPRLLEHRHQVRRGDDRVLSPDDDVARVVQVEEVVRVLLAEVEHLRGVARAGADVAALGGDRAELLEEVVAQVLERAQGPAAAVVEDGRGPRLGADAQELARRRSRAPRPRRPACRARAAPSAGRAGTAAAGSCWCASRGSRRSPGARDLRPARTTRPSSTWATMEQASGQSRLQTVLRISRVVEAMRSALYRMPRRAPVSYLPDETGGAGWCR